jgi:cation:H+ antiporter
VTFALLAGGLALLYFGAEWLVKGAAGLARSFGVPAMIVGLTVVGYGTSAPEMTVSVVAAIRGSSEIALGNVVGSNIANIGLILGITAVVAPPRTDGTLIRREIPLMLATAGVLPLLLWDSTLSRVEGALLVTAAVAFTVWLVRDVRVAAVVPRTMEQAAQSAGAPTRQGRPALVAYAVVGLVMLIAGGELFVRGAVAMARQLGISDHVIGLTVVAVGTSLPELATSVIAARRGHSDIAVGNVVGSNLYNILFVLGATAIVRPITANLHAVRFDLVVLAGMTLFASILLRTERTLQRWEGIALLASYAAFVAYALR